MGELIPNTVDLTQTIQDLRSIDSVLHDSLLDDKSDKGNPFEFTDISASELQHNQFETLDDTTYESSEDSSDHEKLLSNSVTLKPDAATKKPKRSSLPTFEKKTVTLSNYNSFMFKDLKIWYGYCESVIYYGTRGLLSIIYGQRFKRTPVYIISGLLKKLENPNDKVMYYGVAPQTRCFGLILSSSQSLFLIDRYIKKLRYQHIHEDLKEKILEVEKLPEKRHHEIAPETTTSPSTSIRSKKQKTNTQFWFNNFGKSISQTSSEVNEIVSNTEPSLDQLFPQSKPQVDITENKTEKEHVFKIGDIVNIDFRHIDGQIHLGKIISFKEPDNYNVKFAEMDLVYCTKRQRISPLTMLDDILPL